MKNRRHIFAKAMLVLGALLWTWPCVATAQEVVATVADTLAVEHVDSAKLLPHFDERDGEGQRPATVGDTLRRPRRQAPVVRTDTVALTDVGKQWRKPSPKRALWLALVLPGAGQIYNNKYWKLPIIYGGFLGCAYAMRWNNMQYHDYSQAYLDIMDDDPNTQSYNQFLHLGNRIDSSNEARFKALFKKRKDFYRRYRDMSFFIMVGVYALSVIDAYVDASLAQFDISEDLSLRVTPSVINSQTSNNPLRSTALGLQCSINF